MPARFLIPGMPGGTVGCCIGTVFPFFGVLKELSPIHERMENTPSGASSEETLWSTAMGVLRFLWEHPYIPGAIIALVLINFGWRRLTARYNGDGRALPPLGFTIKRIRRAMFIEDTTPVINRPAKVAQKLQWFTWRWFWILTVALAVLLASRITAPLPDNLDYSLAVIIVYNTIYGGMHLRRVFQIRHRILMQMFEVAAAECRYLKGAELNPWGYIQISKWRDLYSPDTTVIMFPPRYRSEDNSNREAFELNFNGTVSDAHTWTYKWESSNNRVIAEPVPFIVEQAAYPFPDTHDWNEFPVGAAAGGKEAIIDVKTYPHLLIAGSTGSGKACSVSTAIPTPSGWTTMGDIRVGDQVFDENGDPCNVTWISDINEQPDLYEVEFSDGTIIRADADHLWWTETRQVRQSRRDAVRKPIRRKPLLPAEVTAKLRAEAARAGDGDEITVPEIASRVGVSASTAWLYKEADRIGHVSENEIITDFHYAEQTVVQRQQVTVFDAQTLWKALASYRPNRFGSSAWHAQLAECRQLADEAGASDAVTSPELQAFLGMRKARDAAALARRAGAAGWLETRHVELVVPAKTVQRRHPSVVRGYPKKEVLEAVAERGEWMVNDQRHRRVEGGVKTTEDILASLRTPSGHVNHAVPVAGPLELPEADLPIDPYTLGAWLGDGNSRTGEICGIDWEIADHVQAAGYELTWHDGPTKTHPNYRVWKSSKLRQHLRSEGLLQRTTEEGSRKRIPHTYLRASIAQRASLLAGLLDTDGTVAPQGTVQFTNTNEALSRQVLELARSLGHRATQSQRWKHAKTGEPVRCWVVSWTCAESPFRLTRKTEAHKKRNKKFNAERNATRFIVDVRPIAPEPARCIAVDSPTRMFLASEAMIPTHNSVTQRTLLLHALQNPDWRIMLIDPKRVELSAYHDHPHVIRVATELEESTELLEQLEQEMQSRYTRMKEEAVNFFKDMQQPPPAILMMVDETFALLSPENIKSDEGKERDEMHARCTVLIGSIARLGRAAGVHMMLATQRPDAKVIPGETRALATHTPILTTRGWDVVENITAGDTVYDMHGQPTAVTGVTEIMTQRQCFTIRLSDGSDIVADAGHYWLTAPNSDTASDPDALVKRSTVDIRDHLVVRGDEVWLPGVTETTGIPGQQPRRVLEVTLASSTPVKCLQVDSATRTFLAGRTFIPTHNSNLDARIAQGRMDTTPSLMTLDSNEATKIPPIKGRAVLRTGNDYTHFQAYFLPPEVLPQVLEMSAALATGMISPDDLTAGEEEKPKGKWASKFKLPPMPSGVSARTKAWVEKRQQRVEQNEKEAMDFATGKKQKKEKKQKPGRGGRRRGADEGTPRLEPMPPTDPTFEPVDYPRGLDSEPDYEPEYMPGLQPASDTISFPGTQPDDGYTPGRYPDDYDMAYPVDDMAYPVDDMAYPVDPNSTPTGNEYDQHDPTEASGFPPPAPAVSEQPEPMPTVDYPQSPEPAPPMPEPAVSDYPMPPPENTIPAPPAPPMPEPAPPMPEPAPPARGREPNDIPEPWMEGLPQELPEATGPSPFAGPDPADPPPPNTPLPASPPTAGSPVPPPINTPASPHENTPDPSEATPTQPTPLDPAVPPLPPPPPPRRRPRASVPPPPPDLDG